MMKCEIMAKGMFTWEGGTKRSTLDYVLASPTWVDLIVTLIIDKENWFDIGRGHNLMFGSFGRGNRGEGQDAMEDRRNVPTSGNRKQRAM